MVAWTPNQTATIQTPPSVTAIQDSSSPKIIPFFTTENDPNQLAFLQSMIAGYQYQHSDVEAE